MPLTLTLFSLPPNPRQERASLSMYKDCVPSHKAQVLFKVVRHVTNVFLFHSSKPTHLTGGRERGSKPPIYGGWKNRPSNTSSDHLAPLVPHLCRLAFAPLLPFTPPSLGHFTNYHQHFSKPITVLFFPSLTEPAWHTIVPS